MHVVTSKRNALGVGGYIDVILFYNIDFCVPRGISIYLQSGGHRYNPKEICLYEIVFISQKKHLKYLVYKYAAHSKVEDTLKAKCNSNRYYSFIQNSHKIITQYNEYCVLT